MTISGTACGVFLRSVLLAIVVGCLAPVIPFGGAETSDHVRVEATTTDQTGSTEADGGVTSVIREGVLQSAIDSGRAKKVVRGPDGAIHAVFTATDAGNLQRIFYAISTDEGRTWTERNLLGTSGGASQRSPTIAVDDAGVIHVVWSGMGFGANPAFVNLQHIRKNASGWLPRISITDVPVDQEDPNIAVDRVGRLHLVWTSRGFAVNSSIRNIGYTYFFGSWTGTVVLTDKATIQQHPSIVASTIGTIEVVWAGAGWGVNSSSSNIQWRRYETGVGWGAVQQVTDRADSQIEPVIGSDQGVDSHVLWGGMGTGGTPGTADIQYRRRVQPTGLWGAQESVTDKSQTQSGPSLALDASGNVHAIWYGSGWPGGVYSVAGSVRTTGWATPAALLSGVGASTHERPVALWAEFPRTLGLGWSQPRTGSAFLWLASNGAIFTLKYMSTADQMWDDAPRAPTLLTPVASATIPDSRPQFSWSYESPAGRPQAGYQFQFAADAGFTAVIVDSGPRLSGEGAHVPDRDLGYGSYYWRIRSQDDLDLWGDWSAGRSITIQSPVPTVKLVSPNGGEDWIKARTYPVVWTCTSPVNIPSTGIQLLYSTNNGDTWFSLASSQINDGVYNWTVLNVNTANALVSVSCTDIYGRSASDVSDASFAIDPPPEVAVPLSSPPAGAIWSAGSHSIVWDPTSLTGTVDMDSTIDAGATWQPIAQGAANSGAFPWDVPAVNTRAAQVRITGTDLEGNPVSSTGPFFVIDSTPPQIHDVTWTVTADGATIVQAKIADNFEVMDAVVLVSRPEGGFQEVPMQAAGDFYIASISRARGFSFQVRASDGANEVSTSPIQTSDSVASVPAAAAVMLGAVASLLAFGCALIFKDRRASRPHDSPRLEGPAKEPSDQKPQGARPLARKGRKSGESGPEKGMKRGLGL